MLRPIGRGFFRTPRMDDITLSGTCSCCDKSFTFSNGRMRQRCKGCSIICCDCCLFCTVIKERHIRKLPNPLSRYHLPLRTRGCEPPKYDVKLCKKCHIIVDDKSSHVKHYHDVMIHTH
jgi:hypothetical protein